MSKKTVQVIVHFEMVIHGHNLVGMVDILHGMVDVLQYIRDNEDLYLSDDLSFFNIEEWDELTGYAQDEVIAACCKHWCDAEVKKLMSATWQRKLDIFEKGDGKRYEYPLMTDTNEL